MLLVFLISQQIDFAIKIQFNRTFRRLHLRADGVVLLFQEPILQVV